MSITFDAIAGDARAGLLSTIADNIYGKLSARSDHSKQTNSIPLAPPMLSMTVMWDGNIPMLSQPQVIADLISAAAGNLWVQGALFGWENAAIPKHDLGKT